MSIRTIKKIIASQVVNMGGNLLDQPLPTKEVDQIDPFLLIHHWNQPLKAGGKQSEVGVGPHPHRGFSPVTFVFKGSLHHQDSIGNNEVVTAGGTQWMHSGKGIVHSERPGKELAENGGENEFIQFWVNTPSKYKMEEPYYLPISASTTPKIVKDNSTISVIAGTFDGIEGPAKTYSPQTLLRVAGEEKSTFPIAIPQNFNAIIYVLNGGLKIDGKIIKDKDMVWFNNDGNEISITITKKCRFILLSGEPIGEKVATYGPFVMNSEQEVKQAIFDFQNGAMGKLVETFT